MTYNRKGPHIHKNPMTIQNLYPDLTPEQQEEAEYNLKRYIRVIERIYRRKQGLPLRREDRK